MSYPRQTLTGKVPGFTPRTSLTTHRTAGRIRDGRPTILVVDDNDGVCQLVKMMLEGLDFRVLTAADGELGVETLRRHADEIALVLLDFNMPQMDGEETFREMRGIRGDIQVIICSGLAEEELRGKFAHHDLAGFIRKPFPLMTLAEHVRHALEA